MKLKVSYGILCIVNIIRILMFIITMLDDMGEHIPFECAIFSFPSSFFFLSFSFSDNLIEKRIAAIGFACVSILWIVIIIASLIGIKYRRAKIVTVVLTIIVSVFDLLPVIFSDIPIKLGAGLVSAVVLSICGKVCFDLKRKDNQDNSDLYSKMDT